MGCHSSKSERVVEPVAQQADGAAKRAEPQTEPLPEQAPSAAHATWEDAEKSAHGAVASLAQAGIAEEAKLFLTDVSPPKASSPPYSSKEHQGNSERSTGSAAAPMDCKILEMTEKSHNIPLEDGNIVNTETKRRFDVNLEDCQERAENAVSGTLEALTAERRTLIQQMRDKLEALPPKQAGSRRHDLWLKRFLAHGSWDLEKAMQLYLDMEAWRERLGADAVLEEMLSPNVIRVLAVDLIGFYPYSYDRHGRSVGWMRAGHIPWWRAIFEKTEETVTSQMWMSEWYEREVMYRAAETGVWRERAVVFVDLSELDFNYFQGIGGSSRGRRRATLQTVSQYYPGNVEKAYVVNAPGFISRAWAMCKMFLSKNLMEKAIMVGDEEERKAMLEDLGPENVPVEFGGLGTAPPNPRLPEKYRKPHDGWASRITAWWPREIALSSFFSEHEETLAVPTGRAARWQWALLYFAITFEVLVRHSDSDWKVLLSKQEYTFYDEEDPVCGDFLSHDVDSEVKLVWHNTASKFRGKTLLLRLQLCDHT